MRTFSVAMVSAWAGAHGSMCPGAFDFFGYGQVSLTNSGWADGRQGARGSILYDTASSGGTVALNLNDRAYFGDVCDSTAYNNEHYSSVRLLGKRLRYTTDISGADCGCNTAMYLVSMKKNERPSTCKDYYCDANKVCGIACTEVDIQEANRYAWHTTLHSHLDKYGAGAGYGGGKSTWSGPRDFTSEEYGPGGSCIDTLKPFKVTTSFPVGADGMLIAMEVELSQDGKVGLGCPLKIRVGGYYKGMVEITAALWEGMTPVVSYWSSTDMLWMDGQGKDKKGPCKNDTAVCKDYARFYDFSVEDLPGVTVVEPTEAIAATEQQAAKELGEEGGDAEVSAEREKAQEAKEEAKTEKAQEEANRQAEEVKRLIEQVKMENELIAQAQAAATKPARPGDSVMVDNPRASCTETGEDCRQTHCCRSFGMQCFEKNHWWAECRETCLPGYDGLQTDTTWSCRPLGERTPDLRAHEIVMLSVAEEDVPPSGSQVTIVSGQRQILGDVVAQSTSDAPSSDAHVAQGLRQRGSASRSGGSGTPLENTVSNKTNSSSSKGSQPQPLLHA